MKSLINLTLDLLSFVYFKISKYTSFYNMSVYVSKIPFSFGNKVRYFYYKRGLKSVGENVLFSYGTIFSHQDISIGDNVRFGPNNTVGLVDFGNDVLIAQNVHFLSGKNQHSFERIDIPINKQVGKIERQKIDSDVWIGCGCIIMSNIGKGCVIGAGSVVVKDLENFSVVAGNPASLVKKRGNEKRN